MTGFLQRIATATLRPETRLKPLAGSIFFAGEVGVDFAEEKPSSPVDPTRRAISMAPMQPARGIETRVEHSYEPSPHETPVPPAPSLATPPPFPPPLASVVSQLTAPRQAVPVTNAPEDGGAKRKTAESRASASLSAPQDRSPPPELRVPQFTPIAKPAEQRQPNAHKAVPQKAPGREAAQADANEVQIHIGRIEVIAVPPPGATAPPTSKNRATSLDDYLRRRNGGAR